MATNFFYNTPLLYIVVEYRGASQSLARLVLLSVYCRPCIIFLTTSERKMLEFSWEGEGISIGKKNKRIKQKEKTHYQIQVKKQQDRRYWEFFNTCPEQTEHRTWGFLFSFKFRGTVVCISQEAQSLPFKYKTALPKGNSFKTKCSPTIEWNTVYDLLDKLDLNQFSHAHKSFHNPAVEHNYYKCTYCNLQSGWISGQKISH